LSEIVIYTQAVKFKAHMKNFISTNDDFKLEVEQRNTSNSFMTPKMRNNAPSLLSGTSLKRQRSQLSINSLRSAEENSITPTTITMNNVNFNANLNADCYKTTSIPESFCRRICKKNPIKCINYSQKHIVRVYPSGMRIDSSNFNPLNFWQFGMQMVALNYQTSDVAMALNSAMFEQWNNVGYMLKPQALWNATHPLFGQFNPLSKDPNNVAALILQLTIISGQYCCGAIYTASPFLEIEIIGVQADCAKEKSKIVGRNSVNPVWNHSTTFR
jgi:phosphatidylinositol phospholipase C epsilon